MIYPVELLKRHLAALAPQLKSLHLLDGDNTPLDIESLRKEMSDRMVEVEFAISVLEFELENTPTDTPRKAEDEVVD